MSWNIKEFRRNLRELWGRYNETSDYQEKDRLLRQIGIIADLICDSEFDRHSDLLLDDSLTTDQIVEAESANEKMITRHMISSIERTLAVPYLAKFTRQLRGFEGVESISFEDDPEPRLSVKDLQELTHEFFKHTTKEIYEYYKQFSDKKIVFNTDRDAGNAFTYINPGVNKQYVDVGLAGDRRRTLQALAHERGHVIGNLLSVSRLDDTDFYYEIEGLFFQLIGEDFFADELNDNAFDRFRLQKLLDYYHDTSTFLRCRKAALKTFDEMSKGENPYTLFHYYSDGEDFSKLDMDDVTRNVFSYLVAIELREVYIEDKELAFELLKQIVKPDKERTEFQRIVETVTPGKSFVKAKNRIYRSIQPEITSISMRK